MINNKKIIIVMPGYNVEHTLEKTFYDIPRDIVDDVILVDDCSTDNTVSLAKKIGIKHIIKHNKNKGYGGNQKTCYDKALNLGADIVVMLHPDYQYTPKLVEPMANIIANGLYPVVLGSRILGKSAIEGGMPKYKYIANRILTFVQNILINQKLSEYHTGYRAYSSDVLRKINYHANSDDYVFDNEMLSQIFMAGFRVGEVSCPANYFKEASSINFIGSIKYGLGVLRVAFTHLFYKLNLNKSELYIIKKHKD